MSKLKNDQEDGTHKLHCNKEVSGSDRDVKSM